LKPTIHPIEKSRLSTVDFNNLPFGKVFSDHMLVADYEDGQWKSVRIVPYGPIELMPAISALHYGQAIFEGMKAYKNSNGEIYLFRPQENFKRFNLSSDRMCMPPVPKEIFIDGLKELLKVDSDWIPNLENTSLSIWVFYRRLCRHSPIRFLQIYHFHLPSWSLLQPTIACKNE
jgi:branched-chain amino acid aminotransferase